MTFKEEIYLSYKQLLAYRITTLKSSLHELNESAANETKSTAGDKHETALAMLQIEQANKQKQLSDWMNQLTVLNNIDPADVHHTIKNGSLVKTNKGTFFISIALGKLSCRNELVFALSPSSPLGNKMQGGKKNDLVVMNGIEYQVLSVE